MASEQSLLQVHLHSCDSQAEHHVIKPAGCVLRVLAPPGLMTCCFVTGSVRIPTCQPKAMAPVYLGDLPLPTQLWSVPRVSVQHLATTFTSSTFSIISNYNHINTKQPIFHSYQGRACLLPWSLRCNRLSVHVCTQLSYPLAFTHQTIPCQTGQTHPLLLLTHLLLPQLQPAARPI